MDTQKLQGLGNLWIEHGTLGYTCIVHYSSRQTHVVFPVEETVVSTKLTWLRQLGCPIPSAD